jgi:hypothetical protein
VSKIVKFALLSRASQVRILPGALVDTRGSLTYQRIHREVSFRVQHTCNNCPLDARRRRAEWHDHAPDDRAALSGVGVIAEGRIDVDLQSFDLHATCVHQMGVSKLSYGVGQCDYPVWSVAGPAMALPVAGTRAQPATRKQGRSALGRSRPSPARPLNTAARQEGCSSVEGSTSWLRSRASPDAPVRISG